MSSTRASGTATVSRAARLDILFDELAELTGQRNAIDGRIVDIVAEIDHDRLWGNTGCRSVAALVAWKTGITPLNAKSIATIAHRRDQFPLCTGALREGRLSLDQVGVIAAKAATGSDEHYAELAASATVTQLRTATALEPPPEPATDPDSEADPEADADAESDAEPPLGPEPELERSITKTTDEQYTYWHVKLPHAEAATVGTAVQCHLDGLIADWKRDHPDSGAADHQRPPLPATIDAFMSLVHAGWDTAVALRPHAQRTTVIVHVDLDKPAGSLHLGPLLSAAERQYLTCDATVEAWLERHGQPLGAARTTRGISRRLRLALEHRDTCCVIPGCGATRGLHAHHIQHWEDGGPTELDNLVLVCPFHHRQHHRGVLTISGDATHLTVTDRDGRTLHPGSLARPPTTPPPAVPPYRGPTGERADWWWYNPFQPQPPPAMN